MKNDTIVSVIICYDFYHNDFHMLLFLFFNDNVLFKAGADPGFQVRGAHLKKLRRTEGGAKMFGVFHVKNHNFTKKNHIFSHLGGGARAGCAPPLDPPL